MKIVNIILGIVCVIAFGTTAMLHTQKGKVAKASEEHLARATTLETELAALRSKHTALAGERDQITVSSGELGDKLGVETTRANQAELDLKRAKLQSESLAAQLQDLSAELRAQKQEVGQLSQARRRLINTFTAELRNREVQITQMGDSLSLEMVGGILFHSGHAGLSDQGMDALERAGQAIKGVEDKLIRIEGHTDDVPIRRRKDTYPTNWELSAARATNVVRFLVDQVGIAPERLAATAMSQYHPTADNGTAEGRAKNRRIVIKLAPMPAVAPPAAEQPAEEQPAEE